MKKELPSEINTLSDGEMKSYEFGDHHILIIRKEKEFHAVGAHCTHYHAPLEEGLLHGDRLICPWHHACFDIKTGHVNEPPAFDHLPVYEITQEDDRYFVDLPDEPVSSVNPLQGNTIVPASEEVYLILGAGAAGFYAVQTLRAEGFNGKVIMVTREDKPPYDRPNLSKDYLSGDLPPEWMPLRPEEFYTDNQIDLLYGKEIERVDLAAQTVFFSSTDFIKYNKLLIATGGKPRQMDVPGNELKGVHKLRSNEHADQLIDQLGENNKVTVIGTGFIGMEASLSLAQRGAKVKVVTPEEVPFSKVLGEKIAAIFQKQHQDSGVEFISGRKVVEFGGADRLEKVILDNGDEIETDLALIAIGIVPVTDFIDGLKKESDGSLSVDEYFRCADNVYAAGDVATFPDRWMNNSVRIEHWRTAQQQGRNAALNMMGKNIPYLSVPFFWTKQGDLSLGYVGHAPDWDEIIYDGEPVSKEFIAYFIKDGKILAAAANYRDPELDAIEELFRMNKLPSPNQVKESKFDVIGFLRKQ